MGFISIKPIFSVVYTYLVIMHLCIVKYLKSVFIYLWKIQKIEKLYVYEYLFPSTV